MLPATYPRAERDGSGVEHPGARAGSSPLMRVPVMLAADGCFLIAESFFVRSRRGQCGGTVGRLGLNKEHHAEHAKAKSNDQPEHKGHRVLQEHTYKFPVTRKAASSPS